MRSIFFLLRVNINCMKVEVEVYKILLCPARIIPLCLLLRLQFKILFSDTRPAQHGISQIYWVLVIFFSSDNISSLDVHHDLTPDVPEAPHDGGRHGGDLLLVLGPLRQLCHQIPVKMGGGVTPCSWNHSWKGQRDMDPFKEKIFVR